MDNDPGNRLDNPLNPGRVAQATVGSFTRDGAEVCRVIAFETKPLADEQSDGDFNDAVLALSIGRMNEGDIAAIHDWVLG